MGSTTDNVKLGVCSVLFDGINLGFTKGGVEVEVSTNTHEVKVDQMGETPIDELITGRMVQATVPLAETTLDNLVRIMPGSTLITNGVKAAGSISLLTAAPVDGDKVTIGDFTFTFKTVPVDILDVLIGADEEASAVELASAINASDSGYVATVAGGVVSLTARSTGTTWNATVSATFATPANATATSLIGGTNATSARVDVTTGVNIKLASIARRLVLRPRGTHGADDFTILKAACPGAMTLSFSIDNERIFNAVFKGYADSAGKLLSVGKAA